jgi:hypothetical protein
MGRVKAADSALAPILPRILGVLRAGANLSRDFIKNRQCRTFGDLVRVLKRRRWGGQPRLQVDQMNSPTSAPTDGLSENLTSSVGGSHDLIGRWLSADNLYTRGKRRVSEFAKACDKRRTPLGFHQVGKAGDIVFKRRQLVTRVGERRL